ncbi:hypothetical protein TB2_029519 [Malus domestica]
MFVAEVGEVERQLPDLLDGEHFAAKNAVHEHYAFEGDDPRPSFFHARGECVKEGLVVEQRSVDPLVHPVEILVIDGGLVMAGGFDDDGFQIRVAERCSP